MPDLAFLLLRYGIFAEGRFMGRVLDEWMNDAQEFVHRKLPHLIVMIIIAFVLIRLLSFITARTVRMAEKRPTPARLAQVRTLSGIIRATGMAFVLGFLVLQILASIGIDLGPLLTSAGIAGVALGLAAQSQQNEIVTR